MPMKRELYPDAWDLIAFAVKTKAEWKCVTCGKQCRRPGEPFDTHRQTLTVAHLNHEPSDCRETNLRALCAPCHLQYDRRDHLPQNKSVPDGCEWDPEDRPACDEDDHHRSAPATWILGSTENYRVCNACERLPGMKRFRKRRRISELKRATKTRVVPKQIHEEQA